MISHKNLLAVGLFTIVFAMVVLLCTENNTLHKVFIIFNVALGAYLVLKLMVLMSIKILNCQ